VRPAPVSTRQRTPGQYRTALRISEGTGQCSLKRSRHRATNGNAGTRVFDLADPPPALVAAIAWNSGEGQVTSLNVWETPEAVADFFMERVRPIVEVEGEPENKPQRHGAPILAYFRK
jgi:hypothetical protein